MTSSLLCNINIPNKQNIAEISYNMLTLNNVPFVLTYFISSSQCTNVKLTKDSLMVITVLPRSSTTSTKL